MIIWQRIPDFQGQWWWSKKCRPGLFSCTWVTKGEPSCPRRPDSGSQPCSKMTCYQRPGCQWQKAISIPSMRRGLVPQPRPGWAPSSPLSLCHVLLSLVGKKTRNIWCRVKVALKSKEHVNYHKLNKKRRKQSVFGVHICVWENASLSGVPSLVWNPGWGLTDMAEDRQGRKW